MHTSTGTLSARLTGYRRPKDTVTNSWYLQDRGVAPLTPLAVGSRDSSDDVVLAIVALQSQ